MMHAGEESRSRPAERPRKSVLSVSLRHQPLGHAVNRQYTYIRSSVRMICSDVDCSNSQCGLPLDESKRMERRDLKPREELEKCPRRVTHELPQATM